MKLLDNIVTKLLDEHVGGHKFFTSLDTKLKNARIARRLISKVKINVSIITSGGFGIYLDIFDTAHIRDIIVTKGSLRHGKVLDLTKWKKLIKGNKWIFLDDSYYTGKTMAIIRNEILRLGGEWVGTYIAYDGSKTTDNTVKSLYRYHKREEK